MCVLAAADIENSMNGLMRSFAVFLVIKPLQNAQRLAEPACCLMYSLNNCVFESTVITNIGTRSHGVQFVVKF